MNCPQCGKHNPRYAQTSNCFCDECIGKNVNRIHRDYENYLHSLTDEEEYWAIQKYGNAMDWHWSGR